MKTKSIINGTLAIIAACLLIACFPGMEKKDQKPSTQAGEIDVSFEQENADGSVSRLNFTATDWQNNKPITVEFDESGKPKFSSKFAPSDSKAFYDVLGKIVGHDAPEKILARIIKEGFDGAGRQVNPLNPALQGLEAGDLRDLMTMATKFKKESEAKPIAIP
jgi:hypothetical protein